MILYLLGFANTAFCKDKPETQNWPIQPKDQHDRVNWLIYNAPPWHRNKIVTLPSSAILFKNPADYYFYLEDKSRLQNLVDSGSVFSLNRGDVVETLEDIYIWSGRVKSNRYGAGYIVINPTF